jgi:putative spermidine/putrescine transport system substrate-binding protein
MQDPAAQIKLLELMGNGPANPAAVAMVPAELRPVDPGSNANVMLKSDGRWWGENTNIADQKYQEMIGS